MRWLIFLSRVSFISGVLMLAALLWGITSPDRAETYFSVAVLAGYGLAAVMLPLMGLIYGVLLIINKKRLILLPRWLLISNMVFLFIFLLFTFYINDPYYHQ